VAADRYQMEQEAQRHLSKGNTDKAITTYAALLRQDPQDRRVRQKMAGLYETVGRTREAEKHYRELVKLYAADGNSRARMATLKQLRKLAPRDGGITGLLAQAYRDSDLPHEAIRHYEQAMNLLAQREPKEAAVFAVELQELKPGDTPLRLRTAELLAAAKDEKGAYKAYRELIDDLRRHGKLSEVGRVAAMALQIKPDESDLLCDAAEASLAGGEPQTALGQLQPAYAEDPQDTRTLDLLARVFEQTEEPEKAREVLLALGRELSQRGDHAAHLSALRRAAKLEVGGSLEAEIARAKSWADAAAFRLGELACAQPRDEGELRTVVRASVMLGYGLLERAQQELDTLPEESLPGRAWTVEVTAAGGETSRAMDLCRALRSLVPPQEEQRVKLRLAVLNGQALDDYLPEPGSGSEPTLDEDELLADDDDELLDDELLDDDMLDDELLDDDDDLIDDEIVDTANELIDDEPEPAPESVPEPVVSAATQGDAEAEAAAFFEDTGRAKSIDTDDTHFAGGDDLLGNLFGDLGPPKPPKPKATPGKLPEFAPPVEDEFSAAIRRGPPQQAGWHEVDDDDPLADACALVDMGLWAEAQAALSGVAGLRGEALRALCLAGLGSLGDAREVLADAADEAEESDAELPEALFHLAALNARARKRRRAIRQLKEVSELAPDFRPVEVQLRLRALEELES
jgi:predicted Zn-dependent protease